MMFRYLCLTLLPAAAMAVCASENTVALLFGFIDADDNGYITPREAYDAFDKLDANSDRRILLDEVQKANSVFQPELEGYEKEVISFLDTDGDGAISYCDVEELIRRIDYNKDGVRSLDEYERYRDEICQSNETTEYDKRY